MSTSFLPSSFPSSLPSFHPGSASTIYKTMCFVTQGWCWWLQTRIIYETSPQRAFSLVRKKTTFTLNRHFLPHQRSPEKLLCDVRRLMAVEDFSFPTMLKLEESSEIILSLVPLFVLQNPVIFPEFLNI